MTTQSNLKPVLRVIAVVAVLFGLLTVISGGSVLFGPETARIAAGNAVNFVLWFNFLAGFFYVFAGGGLWQGKFWAIRLSGLIALMTALVFVALGVHIAGGGLYEYRTLAAMAIRLSLWSLIFFYARRHHAART